MNGRNPDGTFAAGTSGNPAGNPEGGKLGGRPPKRFRLDERIRYRWEAPQDEQPPVAMTPADKEALKLLRTLEELEGTEYVKCLKDAASIAYGEKSENTNRSTVVRITSNVPIEQDEEKR